MQRRFNGDMSREPETLGRRLRQTRLARGMTQTQLAKLSGVKQSDISKLERGDSASSVGIARLARALGVDPLWLELGEGAPPDLAHDPKGMAQELSPAFVTIPPSLTWEKLTTMARVPDKFALTLRDGAMHPGLTKGTEVIFEAAEAAEPGQIVLARAAGGYHVRQLRLQADGSVLAAALSAAWPTFAEFEVVAVAQRVTTDIEAHLSRLA
jgi:transcriptional regulator with XRE-family HTH domain